MEMVQEIYLAKNEKINVRHHIEDGDCVIDYEEESNCFVTNSACFVVAEFFEIYSNKMKHVRQTRRAKEGDILSDKKNQDILEKLNVKALRRELNELEFDTVKVWGGYSPITVNNEIFVPNFNMSGTTYFILDLDNKEHLNIVNKNMEKETEKRKKRNFWKNLRHELWEQQDKIRCSDDFHNFRRLLVDSKYGKEDYLAEIQSLINLDFVKKMWKKVESIDHFFVCGRRMGWYGMGVEMNSSYILFDKIEEPIVSYKEALKRLGRVKDYRGVVPLDISFIEFLELAYISANKEQRKLMIASINK